MSRVPLESSPRAVSKSQGLDRSHRGPRTSVAQSRLEGLCCDSARGSAGSTRDTRGFSRALPLLVRAWNPAVIGTRADPEHPRASMPSIIHPSRPPTRTLPAPTAWIASPACHCRIFIESADTALQAPSSSCTSWSQVLISSLSAHCRPDPP